MTHQASHTTFSSLLSLFTRLCSSVGDVLFPLRCVGCGVYDTLACGQCVVAHLRPSVVPLSSVSYATLSISTIRSVITVGMYADPFWRAVVATLKYHFQPAILEEIGTVLGSVVVRALGTNAALTAHTHMSSRRTATVDTTITLRSGLSMQVHPSLYWCIPVPLHRRRQRERGYNQSGLLANTLAQQCGMTVALQLLQRRVYTQSQTMQGVGSECATFGRGATADNRATGANLDEARRYARQQNVSGTMALYRVPKNINWSRIHVLLVDDVVTTGATIKEAARALAPLGVASIDVVALCHG